ncbi:MAG: DUF1997 domain-containing protein [Cyanobacteria bacterium P01_D01_bin.71]
MQTPFTNRRASNLPDQVLESVSHIVDQVDGGQDSHTAETERSTSVLFHGDYAGCMEMAAARKTVAGYLDDHQAWFLRCAHPMTATPLGSNGYDLTVGHFGALGYDVEPKIGLHLLPQDHGVYRIETIEIPGYEAPGYEVDFKAALKLNETTSDSGQVLTQVDWELDLKVWVSFPRFIQAWPKRIIHKTGEHLLSQIVRQVSKRLTHRVQQDFHETLDLPYPESYRKRSHHFFDRFAKGKDESE